MTPKPIKLNARIIARFRSGVDQRGFDKCWEWTGDRDRNGYGDFRIYRNGARKHFFTHRVAFVVANGDTDLIVCHTCNNPACCNPRHLYTGTQDDNMSQCSDDGRISDQRGESNSHVKLTEDDVRAIRADGRLQREIAEEYSISQNQVSCIQRGKAWKHI